MREDRSWQRGVHLREGSGGPSPRHVHTCSPPFLRQVLVGRTDRDTGAEVRCAEAEAHLASIHGLAELLGVAPAEGADGEARE